MLTYRALERDQIHAIVRVQLRRLEKHLAEQEIALELGPAAIDRVAEEGWDPEFGARPLKRVLQKRVQNLLANAILAGTLQRGQTARVDFARGEFRLETRADAPAEPATAAR